MVRIAIRTVIVALVIGYASALSVDKKTIQLPLKKVSTVTNARNIVARDAARLAQYKQKVSGSSNVEERQTGSAPVINEVFTYLAPVVVGDQTFDLIVDTGSSNTWVGATTKFVATSSAVNTGKSVEVTYGSGSFSGTEWTDTVSLNGITATAVSIGVAKTSTDFEGTDGIIGFGPEDLTEDTVSGVSEFPTFLQDLVAQGVIGETILGVQFAPPAGSEDEDTNGVLTLGGVDTTAFTGSITYTTAIAPWWGADVSDFAFGSTSLGTATASAIVDTGTTLVYVPSSVYSKFLTASKGTLDEDTGLVKFTKAPTSNFSFVFGGTTFTLTPAQYLIPTAQYENWGITGSDFYTFINDGGTEAPDTIIGFTFLEFYYSVFDTTNNRVGLAPNA